MNKRWTLAVVVLLGLAATGVTLGWADSTDTAQPTEPPAIASPSLDPGSPEPQPLSRASCYSTYQSCLASCGNDTACKNECYCQYLDCIGSDAPCPL